MISVIIPVYNVESYLEKCLDSVLSNTYRDLEVICVNDGSTDGCPGILRKWQADDPRIIVIDQENRGLPEARNSGLEIAAGEYIAFIDSDDWIHPRYFESLLNCMEATGADMVVCGCRKIKPEETVIIDSKVEPRYRQVTSQEFYRSYYARHMVWARLLRRRDISELRFPREVDASQDTLYNLRYISSIKQPIVFETETALYYYLQRPGSLARSRPYYAWMQIVDWYMANERDPHREEKGEWAWTLLLQSITIALSCRYQAYLRDNRELISRINAILCDLIADMVKEKSIPLKWKTSRVMMYHFPLLYRGFRLMTDPTLWKYERSIRMKKRCFEYGQTGDP